MKVKYFATYRDITRRKDEDVPAPPDIWTLLAMLAEKYGAEFKSELIAPDGTDVGANAIILVNGRNISHLDGKNTPLIEADVISLFPMVAGG